MESADNVNDRLLEALLAREEADLRYREASKAHEAGEVPLSDVDETLRVFVHATALYHEAKREAVRWSES